MSGERWRLVRRDGRWLSADAWRWSVNLACPGRRMGRTERGHSRTRRGAERAIAAVLASRPTPTEEAR